MKRGYRIVVALVAVAGLASGSIGSVAAYELKSVMISSFKAPGPKGPVALTKTGAGTLRMGLSLVGLSANSTYRIRFSANGCNSSVGPSISNNFTFNSDGNGSAFADTTFDDAAAFGAKTMRLFRGSTQLDCAIAGDFDSDGDVDGADYLTIINKPGGRGIVDVKRTSDPTIDRLTVTISSVVDAADYVMLLSKAPCGTSHQSTDTILSFPFEATQSGTFYRRSQLTHDPEFENWASVRLLTNSQQVACGKTHTTFAV